jgi:hypothetical protein
MKFLMILYAFTYPMYYVPVTQVFDTEAQCLTVAKHIIETHGMYKTAECIPLDGKEIK